MPNIGRPSRGCKDCRQRKRKCDLKRPSCSQCIRAGRDCHGYRDAWSMMFRDENEIVEKRAKKIYVALAMQETPEPRERSHSSANDSDTGTNLCTETENLSLTPPSSAASRYPTPESMTKEILPSMDDQAMGFFISNHVSLPALVPRGQYEWLLEALKQPACEEVLRNSVSAACLAALANSTKNPVIMVRARAAYGSALRMTNNALEVRKTAVKDSTLMSVIMLGMYENFVYQDNQSIQAWAKHVRGASTLLNLRGKEQFESDTARRIFHQFYGTILLVSLQSGSAIPYGIRELYDYCNPTSDYNVQGRQWTVRLAHFLHDSVDLNRDKRSDPVALVTKAIDLGRELDSIMALITGIWQFETVYVETPSEHVHGTFYHVYIDPWIAQMWNNLRLCRMHIYKLIREQTRIGRACNPPFFSAEEAEPQMSAAEQVLQETVAAVCASVPQLTGMTGFPLVPAPKTTESSAKSQPEMGGPDNARRRIHPPGTFLDSARPTGMHHLIWPLYAAGSSDVAGVEMRQYTIDMLYFIALHIGTRQAIVLADSLKEMQVPNLLQPQYADAVFNTAWKVGVQTQV